MKINIGCGRDYREGWINIDISTDCKADEYRDIRKERLWQENGLDVVDVGPGYEF